MEPTSTYGGGNALSARLRSVGREERSVTKMLSEDEKIDIRERLSLVAIKLQQRTEEIAVIAKDHRDEITAIKDDLKALINELRHGSKTTTHDCFLVPDNDGGMMQFVDIESGEVVDERRLRPDERQQTIPFIDERVTT